MKCSRWLCAAAAAMMAVFSLSGHADERAIRQVFKTKLPSAQVISVEKLRYADLYEVAVQGNEGYRVFYTDALGQIMLMGTLIETRTDRNLTEERLRKLSAIDWNKLPFQ